MTDLDLARQNAPVEDEISISLSDIPRRLEASVTIPVVMGPTVSSGIPTVVGCIPAGVLACRFKVPYRDSLRKTGYQRKPQPGRVSKLAKDLRAETVDIPTAVLLNVRERHAEHLIEMAKGGSIEIDSADESFSLYVVDGQHRVLAIRQLCEEDLEVWKNFSVPFVLMLGADEHQELRQFYVVNSNAKSVKTDLAFDLLKQQTDHDGKVMDQAIRDNKAWQISGQCLVDVLNKTSPIWKDRIRLANEDKGDKIIPAASFISSLKPLVSSHYFGQLGTENQVRVLNAFWKAVKEVCPQPFEGQYGSDGDLEFRPSDFTLQKGIGVTAMHELLLVVLEHVRSRGASVFDSAAYVDLLAPVFENVHGDNTDGETVQSPEFWLVAPKGGAAGGFSSSAGKRVLRAMLLRHLPDMEVE
ncbi:MAG: DGQHR domain-containing protein [Rhodospirillaceae bacterium]|nr:DGQHR domain-containing protein [Rhodospirillaceae bacterium]MDE0616595.1 DGQHR domain-containing protein [Rhodospirillaceae bacterium]